VQVSTKDYRYNALPCIITVVAHQLFVRTNYSRTRSEEAGEPDRSQRSDVARSDSLPEGPTGDGAGNETKRCHGDIVKKVCSLCILVMTTDVSRAILQSVV
jgi:hypothetical protein